MEVDVIPTGNLLIDRALGVGGSPADASWKSTGPESSGKTTLTLTAIAQAQKSGGLAAFIDVEHALDPQYARLPGVNRTTCWSPSRTRVKKPCKSAKPWCVPTPSTSSWWTP